MLRSKILMIVLAAAALGVGAALLGELPAKAWASVMTPTVAEAPAPPAAPVESATNFIRIDGERSELRLEGKDTGLHADKDGLGLRTLYGKFELRW